MNQMSKRHEFTMKKVVYEIPEMSALIVKRDLEYHRSESGPLTADLYYPSRTRDMGRRPAVLFVSGYPDPGFEAMVGCKFKEMESYVSWSRLVAASGMIAVTYSNHDPVADLTRLLTYLRQNAAALGIDERRVGVWACSGNVPVALSRLVKEDDVPFAVGVLCYGPMFDPDGTAGIASAATRMGFAYPIGGKTVDDMPLELPLMIVRAGKESMPGLNDTIDRFIGPALNRNLPLTLLNHASAPHAFDIVDNSETTREVIRMILAFLRFHLLGSRG